MSAVRRKTCFVTIGATASFTALIRDVLSPEFRNVLQAEGFTDLLVQYGKNGLDLFKQYLGEEIGNPSLRIAGFDLDTAGLHRYMVQARGTAGDEGVVISHAGSGTVLDALRVSAPLIVVPNSELLDNHQVELAEALAEQGYVIHGVIGRLDQALRSIKEVHARQGSWPPVNSSAAGVRQSLKGVIEDELGLLD